MKEHEMTPSQRRIVALVQYQHEKYADKPLRLYEWNLNIAASETIDLRDVVALTDAGYFRADRGPYNHCDYYATERLLAARVDMRPVYWRSLGWRVFFFDGGRVCLYFPSFRAAYVGQVDGGRWMNRLVLDDDRYWRQLDMQTEGDPWLLRQCYIRDLACYCGQLVDSSCDFCTGLRTVTNEVLADAVRRALAADNK